MVFLHDEDRRKQLTEVRTKRASIKPRRTISDNLWTACGTGFLFFKRANKHT